MLRLITNKMPKPPVNNRMGILSASNENQVRMETSQITLKCMQNS